MADPPKGKDGKGGKKILGMPRQTGMFVVVAALAGGGLLLLMWLKNRNAAGQQQPQQDTSGSAFGPGDGQSTIMETFKTVSGHQPHGHGGSGGGGGNGHHHRGRHDAGTLGGSAHNPKG